MAGAEAEAEGWQLGVVTCELGVGSGEWGVGAEPSSVVRLTLPQCSRQIYPVDFGFRPRVRMARWLGSRGRVSHNAGRYSGSGFGQAGTSTPSGYPRPGNWPAADPPGQGPRLTMLY